MPNASSYLQRASWTLFIVLSGLPFLGANKLLAGHIAGNSITYACIGTCTLRVDFKAYRDCSSPIQNVSPLNTVSFSAAAGCTLPSALGPWQNQSNLEVTPVCPGTPTACSSTSASLNGIMEHHWTREYDICSLNCIQYTISWTTCCRNSGITTLANPASTALYASTTFNPALSPCNSTPTFTTPPIAYLCQGQGRTVSQGASDLDGDSLSYQIGPCMRSATQTVPYLAFTSPTQPLGPDWTVSLTSDGDLSVLPNPGGPNPGSIQVGVICLYVTEWRNGAAINTIQRDMQVTVIACPGNTVPQITGPAAISNASLSGDTIQTCIGATVCAEFGVKDPDMSQIQMLWWDPAEAPSGAFLSSTLNPSILDTITGNRPSARFCWKPTQAGIYRFRLFTRDDACPIYAESHIWVTIEVTQIEAQVQVTPDGCRPASLCAIPLSGTYPISYAWSGSGGIGNNPSAADSCLLHTFPSAGSFPVSVTVTDAWGCFVEVRDTVSIVNNVTAQAGNDTTICAGDTIRIGIPPSGSLNWSYQWTPAQNLNDNTSPNPAYFAVNTGSLPVMCILSVQAYDSSTGCSDLDQLVITILPAPAAVMQVPDTGCLGQDVAFQAQAVFGQGQTQYIWQAPAATPSTFTGLSPAHIVFSTAGMQQVSLMVVQGGCSSSVAIDSVLILDGPSVEIEPVANQCQTGNAFQFVANGTASNYQWQFGPQAFPAQASGDTVGPVSFSTSGSKFAIVQGQANGCLGKPDTVSFAVIQEPVANWLVIGGVQCFDGNQLQFQALGNYGPSATYSWNFEHGSPASSNLQNPSVHFLSPGIKTVEMTVTVNGCSSTKIDSVEVFAAPVVDAGPDIQVCDMNGGAQAQVSIQGGTPPYLYQWYCPSGNSAIDSLHDDDPVLNPAQEEWFYFQVIDANGCYSAMDSLFVDVLPRPEVRAGPDQLLCGDSSGCVTLQGMILSGPSVQFEWQPPLGLSDPDILMPCASPDSTTTYLLLAIDTLTGCQSLVNDSSQVTVTRNPVPLAYSGVDKNICEGDTAFLQGSATGGIGTYSYFWGPPQGLFQANQATVWAGPSATTTYFLSVQSGGCQSPADSVTVFVHRHPTVDAGVDQEICFGDSILLDASAIGDSSVVLAFHWYQGTGISNPNLEDPIVGPAGSTTYSVMVTTQWGCKSPPDSVRVNLIPTPEAYAGADLIVCEGDTATLRGSFGFFHTDSIPGSEVSVQWSSQGGFSNPGQLQQSFVPDSSGWYVLTTTYGRCSTSDSVFLRFIPNLNAQILADTQNICVGDTLPIQASGGHGGAMALWTPAAFLSSDTGFSVIAFPPDTSQIMLVLEEEGCTDTATWTLNVLPVPHVAATPSDPSGCAPHTVSFLNLSDAPGTCTWAFGDGSFAIGQESPVHTFQNPGTYHVSLLLEVPGMCASQSDSIEVVVFAPPVVMVDGQSDYPRQLYLPVALFQSSAINTDVQTVQWDLGDGSHYEGQSVLHAYQLPGTYIVQVRIEDENGCVSEEVLGPVIVSEPELEIPNVFTPNGDGVQDDYLVNYQGNEPFRLQINDRWGNLLFETRDRMTGWHGIAKNGTQAPDGVYYYVVEIGQKSFVGDLTLIR